LHYNPDSGGSRALLSFAAEEVPCAVQLFGADPAMMAAQAAAILERHASDVALIDINMGCPVNKVVQKGEGSALMCDAPMAAAIVSAVRDAVDVPVTVKFRKGWDDASLNAVDFARAMEAAGAAAVAVHGRTREQFYRGDACWDTIADVKRSVSVPVIGSGDVFSADDVVAMFERTGCDAVMVARGAQGNPWIFREARALIDRGERIARPSDGERLDMALEHARALVAFKGERAIVRMRKHVAWYVAGMPGASYVRTHVNTVNSYDELEALFAEYRAFLEA
ncbi:MAG: tRNA dihydrouridine synthase DusB, partial [Actinobacteria bacterium]